MQPNHLKTAAGWRQYVKRHHHTTLVAKNSVPELRWLARALNLLPLRNRLGDQLGDSFMHHRWNVYKRWPWAEVLICYPPLTNFAEYHVPRVIRHELHHVGQLRRWWQWFMFAALYFVLPLPVFFSGRWRLERQAFLADIQQGYLTVEKAVNALWSHYAAPWPRPLMRRWFNRNLAPKGH